MLTDVSRTRFCYQLTLVPSTLSCDVEGGRNPAQLCCRFAVSPMPREGRGNAATLEVIVGRLATVLDS